MADLVARRSCSRGTSRLLLLAFLFGCQTPAPVEPVDAVADEAPTAGPDEEAGAPAPAAPDEDEGTVVASVVSLGGEPTVLGAMARDTFVTTVEAHLPALSKCVRSSVSEPNIIVKVTITKDGAVSGASMRASSGSPGVDRCLEKAFMAMKFPPAGTGLVVAAVPLYLGQTP